nr:PspC domain-containing protein [Candidatus Woesearchaeota archaeon]
MKRLYRSNTNKVLAGVCGGIGEYFDIDPVIIRLIWVLFLFMGAGIIAYIIAWIVIPKAPKRLSIQVVKRKK